MYVFKCGISSKLKAVKTESASDMYAEIVFKTISSWSSTFHIITNEQKARPILNGITTRHPDLHSFEISDSYWLPSTTVANILQTAASLSECQSGSNHDQFRMNIRALRGLETNYRVANCRKMLSKIDKYHGVIMGKLVQLAKLRGRRFGNGILVDSDICLKYDEILTNVRPCNAWNNTGLASSSGSEFMGLLLEEDSINECFDDKNTSFLRNTAVGENRADQFLWWNSNNNRYPHVEVLVRDILSIQSSSMASEEMF